MARPLTIIFWSALSFALVMALLPIPPQLPGSPSDKAQHILAFLVLAALGRLAYPAAGVLKLLLGLSAFGALIEIAQAIPGLNRDPDLKDWVADTAAAALMLLLVASLGRLRNI